MTLQKKELKKQKQTLKFEKWIYIYCPECEKNGENIKIALPLADLPDKIRCFSCDSVIKIKGILKKGTEIKRR